MSEFTDTAMPAGVEIPSPAPISVPPSGGPELTLVSIPPGSFVMGAGGKDKFATDTERPPHRVTISRAFSIGQCPVTVGQYRAFAPEHGPGEAPNLPVVNVTWWEAAGFCAWLRTETGRPFRLPSEAEWEYACRAGAATSFASGDSLGAEAANFLYDENGIRIGVGRRTPVGSYQPNFFGAHDLHGNVCEWVEDLWHPTYAGAPDDGAAWLDSNFDPAGEASFCTCRVIRGGAWDQLPRLLRSAGRDRLPPEARRDNVGFRVAIDTEE